MRFNISIIDDDKFFSDLLSEELRKLVMIHDYQIRVTCFASGEEFFESDVKETDLAFIDIELPGISGLQIANQIRELSPSTIMAFITNHSSYVFDAFGFNVTDYIIKPSSDNQIPLMVVEVKDLLERTWSFMRHSRFGKINLKTPDGNVICPIDDILYIETVKASHKIALIKIKGEPIIMNVSIDDFEKAFTGLCFFRVHRCYMVNIHKITNVSTNSISLINGKTIPMSRKRRNGILSALHDNNLIM